MNREIENAYSVLRRATPLCFDCGKLCGALCCKGDENTGMELFCGEEERFKDDGCFEIREAGQGRKILVCRGECDRNNRPLSCRFFPLFPLCTQRDGEITIKVIFDPRAVTCPIYADNMRITPAFYKAVRRAALYMLRDEILRKQLLEISDTIDDIIRLRKILLERK